MGSVAWALSILRPERFVTGYIVPMTEPQQLKDFVALVTARAAARAAPSPRNSAPRAPPYVTGRSIAGGPTTDNVPGTIDDTAREVTERGGRGIAVRCDHTVDADVESLFARIRSDHDRPDLLVNNVWGGYEDSQCRPLPRVPLWEQSMHQWDGHVHRRPPRASHRQPSGRPPDAPREAAALSSAQQRASTPSRTYRNVYYDLSKNAGSPPGLGNGRRTPRPPHRVSWASRPASCEPNASPKPSVAPAPPTPWTVRNGPKETPAYLARAIVALASDPQGPEEIRPAPRGRHPRARIRLHRHQRHPTRPVQDSGEVADVKSRVTVYLHLGDADGDAYRSKLLRCPRRSHATMLAVNPCALEGCGDL